MNLVEKIQELEEKLDKKKEDDEISEFERTKRAVKEEASKTKVDIDILHEKLIAFENLARKRNHELKDKITLILSRFHIHKNRPAFAAALMLKLVCSKEEEAVLDKEQKLMKSFGFMDNRDNLYNVQSMLPSSHVPPGFMGQLIIRMYLLRVFQNTVVQDLALRLHQDYCCASVVTSQATLSVTALQYHLPRVLIKV